MKKSRFETFQNVLPWIILGVALVLVLTWILATRGPERISLEVALGAAIVMSFGLVVVLFTAKELRGYEGTDSGSGMLIFLHGIGWSTVLGGLGLALINPYG